MINEKHCFTTNIYKIIDEYMLSQLTTYSIRVGTYVALYVLERSTSFIQFHLHWNTTTFTLYLRNNQDINAPHYDALQVNINYKIK